MRHLPHNRLPRWLRRGIYALTTLLLGSGIAWLGAAYLLAAPGEDTPAPHPWAGPALAIHGIAAQAALVAYALVGQAHLRAGWRTVAQRRAGVGLALAVLLLMSSGLGFYYGANEAALPWLRWSHVAIGTALPVLLGWHVRRGRRLRQGA